MKVATARYQARDLIRASGLAPVGITVGRPRWKLGYDVVATAPGLTPEPWMVKKLDRPTFERRYVNKLEATGPDEIRGQLEEVAQLAGTDGVVLLCFEDVRDPDLWCHRRMFARWFEEQTGQHVPDLEEGDHV